jgi:NlpC/P60 family
VTKEQREREGAAIARCATEWIDTPFHSHATIKGKNGGVDCAMLPACVFKEALGIEFSIPEYLFQWHLHADPLTGKFRQLLIDTLLKNGFVEISESELGPGDIVTGLMGEVYAHCAIIVDWPFVIHASDRRGVKRIRWHMRNQMRIFSWGPWHESIV